MNPRPTHEYPIDPEMAGWTLVAAVRHWQQASWSEARKLIRSRRVLVNGALSLDEARRLTLSETVCITDHSAAPPPRAEAVVIVHRDADLVVVNKPAGMTTLRHRAEQHWPEPRKQAQPTLDECIEELLAESTHSSARSTDKAPRSVHRIDRDTSGLVVFALTEAAEKELIRQFAEHSILRSYQAVVWGHPAAQRIETRLVRDRGDGLRGSTTDPEAGKPAVTHIRPLETLGPYSLLECRLETGRTHQIRIHLSELGHPVCGDIKYGLHEDSSGAPRLALHAAELGFQHPKSGQALHFSAPLPKDLARWVEKLRSRFASK